jgi:hypothetical protein
MPGRPGGAILCLAAPTWARASLPASARPMTRRRFYRTVLLPALQRLALALAFATGGAPRRRA